MLFTMSPMFMGFAPISTGSHCLISSMTLSCPQVPPSAAPMIPSSVWIFTRTTLEPIPPPFLGIVHGMASTFVIFIISSVNLSLKSMVCRKVYHLGRLEGRHRERREGHRVCRLLEEEGGAAVLSGAFPAACRWWISRLRKARNLRQECCPPFLI